MLIKLRSLKHNHRNWSQLQNEDDGILWGTTTNRHLLSLCISIFVFARQSSYVHSDAVQSKTKVKPSQGIFYYTISCMKVLFCLSTLFTFSSLVASYICVSIYLLFAHPPGFLLVTSNLSFVILSNKLWLPTFLIQNISLSFWLCFHPRRSVPPAAVPKETPNISSFSALFLSASVSKPKTWLFTSPSILLATVYNTRHFRLLDEATSSEWSELSCVLLHQCVICTLAKELLKLSREEMTYLFRCPSSPQPPTEILFWLLPVSNESPKNSLASGVGLEWSIGTTSFPASHDS